MEAKARFSALLAEVEAGAEIAVTRHGKIIARIVPDHPQSAADVFRDFWPNADEIDRLAAGEDDDLPSLHGWRYEVFGKDAIALRKGELAIAVENGEAVVVELEEEPE